VNVIYKIRETFYKICESIVLVEFLLDINLIHINKPTSDILCWHHTTILFSKPSIPVSPLMNDAVFKMLDEFGVPDEMIAFDDFGG